VTRRGAPTTFAVVGADHLHLFQMVDRLVAAGATAAAHAPQGGLIELYADWQSGSAERTVDGILADESIDLVVVAGVPSERAEIAVAALRADKHVLSDKPGVTNPAQLDDVRAAIEGRPGRPWTVLFSERFENRAIGEAIDLSRAGAVGSVVHVVGGGPHLLNADNRPAWFWNDAAPGGILVDIGSHQADQFLAIVVGADGASAIRSGIAGVRQSSVGNVTCAEHPTMQDIGSMTLVADGVVGDHRVDYLTAAGLGVWGDVRLTIIGTEGTIEVRANVDPAGEPEGEHLIVVDGQGTRRIDVSERPIDWAERLLVDVADDGETLMSQTHVLDVCDLVLRAQRAAVPWGRG